jgi:hypothetical protein
MCPGAPLSVTERLPAQDARADLAFRLRSVTATSPIWWSSAFDAPARARNVMLCIVATAIWARPRASLGSKPASSN